MVDAFLKELSHWKALGWNGPWNSVYLGGGTPSLLKPSEIGRLLEVIYSGFDIIDDAEITLEANPDDLRTEALSAWRSLGINRLSIGIQSFSDPDLEWMNRSHNAAQAIESLVLARKAGFEQFSIDLIYGLPHSEAWERNVQTALDLQPPHISAYSLTVEPQTVLANRVRKGIEKESPDGKIEREYQFLCQQLSNAGYRHYEISNFALPGQEAVHNQAYWNGDRYLGIGPSAHSFDGKRRWWNVANNARYKKSIQSGSGWFEEEFLSANDKWNEQLMTGLRTVNGIDVNGLRERLPEGAEWPSREAERLLNRGWLEEQNGHWRIPEIHWLLADHVIAELMC